MSSISNMSISNSHKLGKNLDGGKHLELHPVIVKEETIFAWRRSMGFR